MPDLHDLLQDAARPPANAPDPGELWIRGRRRRRVRHAVTGAAGVVAAGVVALAAGGVLPDRSLLVEPAQPDATEAPETAAPVSEPDGAPTPTSTPSAPRTPSPEPSGVDAAAETWDGSTVVFTTEPAPSGPALGTAYTVRQPSRDPAVIRYGPDGAAETLVPPSDWRVEGRIAVAPDGNLGVTLYGETSGRSMTVILPQGRLEGRVLATARRPGEQRHVVGAGDLDGPVVLAAEGRATSVADDDGTDLVAYRPDGSREVLVEDAAAAWEGGIVAAVVRDGWLAWHVSAGVRHSLVAMPLGAREPLLAVPLDPEGAQDPYPVDLALRTTADGPVLQAVLHHPVAYPDPVRVELRTYQLPAGEARTYRLDGFGWDVGLPYSLSVLGGELVIGRVGEQSEPLPAWIGTVGSHRDLDVRGEVRLAR